MHDLAVSSIVPLFLQLFHAENPACFIKRFIEGDAVKTCGFLLFWYFPQASGEEISKFCVHWLQTDKCLILELIVVRDF